MAQPLALLIEDDRFTAQVVLDWLCEAGWRVTRAVNGTEGLRRFSEARPDLVICDILLPGIDGATVCTNVRMQPYGDRVRFILVSARPEAADAARAAGADAFLVKPLRPETLLAAAALPVPEERAPSGPVATAVRLPAAGSAQGASAPIEEGVLGPGVFASLLRRLHERSFSGILEADTAEGNRVKLYFARGMPAAARSSDAATGFGQIALALGLLTPRHLEDSVAEGRATGTPLGEVLLRSRLIDRLGVEQVLREQLIRRAVEIGRASGGSYTLDSGEPIGLAGFDVHPAAIAWRLGAHAPPLPIGVLGRYTRPAPVLMAVWRQIDPHGEHAVLRALLVGGATGEDCVSVCGAAGAALLAHLHAWNLVDLVEEPPLPTSREAGLAELDTTDLAATLAVEHRALLDATHYTVLGLTSDADAEAVSTATLAVLARLQPDSLPAALDATSRARARAIHERALEAGRVLSDPAKRSIYDARLRGETRVATVHVREEGPGVLQADRARELLRVGAYTSAAGLLASAVRREGEAADLLAMLGWARHCACPDDPDAGEPELRRAVALDPEDEVAVCYLARVLAGRGDTGDARRLLRGVLSRNHESELARDALREIPE